MSLVIDVSKSPLLKRLFDEAERQGRRAAASKVCLRQALRSKPNLAEDEQAAIKLFSEHQSETFIEVLFTSQQVDKALTAALEIHKSITTD